MLKRIGLFNVGPATTLILDPIKPRFNFVTGDNGLGKSFLLDVAWWCLTRTWHETPAIASSPDARIEYVFDGLTAPHETSSKWNPKGQAWRRKMGKPPNPGLVLYARVDGSFSVWDPARNYRLYQSADGAKTEAPSAFQFGSAQVLHGLKREVTEGGVERTQVICSGLIADWVLWQRTEDPKFELLKNLLRTLGPHGEPLVPGEPSYPTPDDDRGIPTIRMSYGQDVPITYAPAGVKRTCMLAYLLAWALSAHERETARNGLEMTNQIILLVDEPETHLHPRWQRTILPSLHTALKEWHRSAGCQVQFLVATHSPLVLASMEPIFDPDQDALWKLDLNGGQVAIEQDNSYRRGDASAWLTSDVFDLKEAKSVEAEDALGAALALLKENAPTAEAIDTVTAKLAATLTETDRFWMRWAQFAREQGRLA